LTIADLRLTISNHSVPDTNDIGFELVNLQWSIAAVTAAHADKF